MTRATSHGDGVLGPEAAGRAGPGGRGGVTARGAGGGDGHAGLRGARRCGHGATLPKGDGRAGAGGGAGAALPGELAAGSLRGEQRGEGVLEVLERLRERALRPRRCRSSRARSGTTRRAGRRPTSRPRRPGDRAGRWRRGTGRRSRSAAGLHRSRASWMPSTLMMDLAGLAGVLDRLTMPRPMSSFAAKNALTSGFAAMMSVALVSATSRFQSAAASWTTSSLPPTAALKPSTRAPLVTSPEIATDHGHVAPAGRDVAASPALPPAASLSVPM